MVESKKFETDYLIARTTEEFVLTVTLFYTIKGCFGLMVRTLDCRIECESPNPARLELLKTVTILQW